MNYLASSFSSLSRLVEKATEPAVVFDLAGEVVLYNDLASHFRGARQVEPGDELPTFRRASMRGQTVNDASLLLLVEGRGAPVELTASLHPIRSTFGAVVAILAFLRPSPLRSKATLRRAALTFLEAARSDQTSGALIFDRELHVIAQTGAVTDDPLPYCRRALTGEVCREPLCGDCELHSGPIRDSLGLIVGGVVVAYESQH